MEMEFSNFFVCAMCMGVTFVGLICLIGLIYLQSMIFGEKPKPAPVAVPASASISAQSEVIANRGELVAAISAALAEDMGVDVTAIRILSMKKIG